VAQAIQAQAEGARDAGGDAAGERCQIEKPLKGRVAEQKGRMGLFIRTIGIARATTMDGFERTPSTTSSASSSCAALPPP
jgi:hypothetical protein